MKKSFIYAGAILAATISLTNCTKEINSSEAALPEGIPFEICANPTTKTTIDGLSTKWADGDGINVFHAAAGSTSYVSDNEFTIAGDLTEGRFAGKLSDALGDGTYDWYAIYPYSEHIVSPANTSTGYSYIGSRSDKSQSQTGVDNMSHIAGENYPLYGKSTAPTSASEMPSINMKPAFSVLRVKVTNSTGSALEVSNISFTAPEAIVGTFYIDFSGDAAVYTAGKYVSEKASLTVTDASIDAGASAEFYLAVKPFTAKTSSNLTLSVNGYEKKITLTKDIAFTAGHIKTLGFEFDKVQTDYIELPWTEDFSGDLSKYTLTNGGTTTKIYDEASAGGEAPELLISKNNGSFSAKIKAVAGEYLLTFKSNHPEYLTVSTSSDAVNVAKVHDNEYTITIPDGLDYFTLALKNTNSSNNTRVDDIAMFVDERVALQAPANLMADLLTDSPNSIEVVWDAVENAGSYVVTATPAEGMSVTKEVTEPSCLFSELKYDTAYTISVYAKPADITAYLNSEKVTLSEPIVTGANPYGETHIIEINTKNSGVTGSYASKTFQVDGLTFGFTDWMKSTNIQAKKSTSNSCYNSDPLPGVIISVTIYQTGTPRAVKVFGGTSSKPTNAISQPKTGATMKFDFSGKEYNYFSITTPGNACYFDKIEIEYAVASAS